MTETPLENLQQQENVEHHPSLPTDFVHPKTGETYRYDTETLVVEQCEYAQEILEWKRDQLKQPASSFTEISRSRGAEWLSLVASYILVPVKNGIAQPFNLATIAETERFVKVLPAKQLPQLKEVITDFFTSMNKRGAILQLLQNRGGLSAETIVSELLTRSLSEPNKPASGGKQSSKKR